SARARRCISAENMELGPQFLAFEIDQTAFVDRFFGDHAGKFFIADRKIRDRHAHRLYDTPDRDGIFLAVMPEVDIQRLPRSWREALIPFALVWFRFHDGMAESRIDGRVAG